jgi:hypothetical protein
MSSSPITGRTRRGVWQHAVASTLRIEWTDVEPGTAIRCTLGVGIPLSIALLLNQPTAGLFITIGSVSTGFGTFQGAYRSRAATMLYAAAGMAFSLFAGSLAGHSTVIATAVAAAWGFAAGLLVALGPAAAFVALQSTVAVLIAGAYPADLNDAIRRGLLVLAGGLGQVLLVVSLWPLKRFETERRFIGQVYGSLADYAATVNGVSSTPEPHTLTRSGALQGDPQPFARSSELLVFHGLLEQAERIRVGLAALSFSARREADSLTNDLSVVLREIADAVGEARAPAGLHREWEVLDAVAADRRNWMTPIGTLLAQVRAAWRIAAIPSVGRTNIRPVHHIPPMPPMRNALLTIRANLSFRSTAFRHAVRMATALALATAVYRLAELPRGFWFPMTTLLVLKPEFHETYVTGIARILGTLAGAGIAALLVEALGSHPVGVVALLLVCVWGGYAFFRANYTVFTICITGYIVLLMELASVVPGTQAATYRAIDTILGGALALTIYRLWPTWEASHLPEVFAVEAQAIASYSEVLLTAYVDPARWDPHRLQQTRAAGRLARSNAEASVERALREPPGPDRFDAELALSLLVAFRRFALAALALDAGLDRRPAYPRRELEPLRDQIVTSLRMLAIALRDGKPPGTFPPLVQTLSTLQPTVDPAFAEQTEVLVESVTTMGNLLTRRRL